MAAMIERAPVAPTRRASAAVDTPIDGASLDADTRARMEPLVGASLGDVRLHAGRDAAAAAAALNAAAFTVGRDVYFATNAFAPRTARGRGLLAHELVHVAQQRRGAVPVSVQCAPVATTSEASAAAVAGSGTRRIRVTIYSGDPYDPQGETAKGIAEKRFKEGSADLVLPIQQIEDIGTMLDLYAFHNLSLPQERLDRYRADPAFRLVPADHPGFVREISIIGHGNAATKKSEPFYAFGGVAYKTSELAALHANGLDLSRYLTSGASVVLEGCKAAKGPEGRDFLCEVGKIFLGGHKRGRVQGNTNETIGFAGEIMGGDAQIMKWPEDCVDSGIPCDPLQNTPSGFACFPKPGGDGFRLVKTE